jgi:hypothetical protein
MTNQEQNIENLHIHIQGLQATLAKRNLLIANMKEDVANPDLRHKRELDKAYKDGWRACAEELMSETATMANSLLCLRSKAFESLLKNEKR